jgi:hypothetical protein
MHLGLVILKVGRTKVWVSHDEAAHGESLVDKTEQVLDTIPVLGIAVVLCDLHSLLGLALPRKG